MQVEDFAVLFNEYDIEETSSRGDASPIICADSLVKTSIVVYCMKAGAKL